MIEQQPPKLLSPGSGPISHDPALFTEKQYRCWQNILAGFDYHNFPRVPLKRAYGDRCFFEYRHGFLRSFLKSKKFNLTPDFNWREAVPRFSMEITFHGSTQEIEADYDYWNPDYGLGPALLHGLECLQNKIFCTRTDPFKIAKGLKKRGILR